MLVLNRRVNESIMIGDHVKIVVIKIGPKNVQIGIDAPRSQRISRGEAPAERRDAQGTEGP